MKLFPNKRTKLTPGKSCEAREMKEISTTRASKRFHEELRKGRIQEPNMLNASSTANATAKASSSPENTRSRRLSPRAWSVWISASMQEVMNEATMTSANKDCDNVELYQRRACRRRRGSPVPMAVLAAARLSLFTAARSFSTHSLHSSSVSTLSE